MIDLISKEATNALANAQGRTNELASSVISIAERQAKTLPSITTDTAAQLLRSAEDALKATANQK